MAAFLLTCCHNVGSNEIENIKEQENQAQLSWYNSDEDVFCCIDTVDRNMKISIDLPAIRQTFFKSKNNVITVWSYYENAEIPELNHFTARNFDEVDIWFVDQDNWNHLISGDSLINGDFIITLYYGDDTVIVRGVSKM